MEEDKSIFDKNRIVLNPNKKQTPYEYIIICKNTLESKLNSIKQPYIDGDKLKERIVKFQRYLIALELHQVPKMKCKKYLVIELIFNSKAFEIDERISKSNDK